MSTATAVAGDLVYAVDRTPTLDQFLGVLQASGLAERRPVDDRARMARIVAGTSLWVTAWDGDRLVGVSRALTDFAICCYLADLAVDERWKGKGVGRRLIALTREAAGGEDTGLTLLAAPAAQGYYAHAGLEASDRCWTLPRGRRWP